MTYTAVPDVAEGDSWTAKNMNKYVRDNFTAGVPDIFTTKGDIAVATGNNAATIISAGSNNAYYIADDSCNSGIVSTALGNVSASPAGSSVSLTDDQWNHITWITSEEFDTASAYSGGIFTVPHIGYYFISFGMRVDIGNWTVSGYGHYIKLGIYKNDSLVSVIAHKDRTFDNIQGYEYIYGWDILALSSGDELKPMIYESIGTSPDASVDPSYYKLHIIPLI